MTFALAALAGAVFAVICTIVLIAVYQAGKQEGFEVATGWAREEPPTHAEMQAAAAREGRQ